MRYAFDLDGRRYHVTVDEHADGPHFIVDGTPFEAVVEPLGPGSYRVRIGNTSHEFTVKNGLVLEGRQAVDLEVRRTRPELQRSSGRGNSKEGTIKPPMPGKIVEVRVREGDVVAEGDTLMVLEAMKMQNDLKSPIAGTVSKINVADGQNVEAGNVLLVVDAVKLEE